MMRRRQWMLVGALTWAASVTALAADAPAPAVKPMPANPSASVPATSNPPPAKSTGGLSRWFNPATAPFIPVPEIATDPDSGTTLGVLAVWVKTDDNHAITQIIAPDVLHNPNFGFGTHARIYRYPSADEQWSVVAGIKQRVEREFDAEYQTGRLRDRNWSFNYSAIYDVDGTPRFYGIGNRAALHDETSYTNDKKLLQVQAGYNFSRAWQLQYTLRAQHVVIKPGTVRDVDSIDDRFEDQRRLGTQNAIMHRLSLIYDTRDDNTVPKTGAQIAIYGGVAGRTGLISDSMYSEAGVDGRAFWPLSPVMVLAAHMALRYLPTTRHVPFWALSSIGGGESEIGGRQPLRGFGAGRFYDKNSFASSIELRRHMFGFDAVTTHVELEIAPFLDVGRVFSKTSTFPLNDLHYVAGVGFRGIARPFVVGKVDIGYGSEGVAIFTGLNYPF